MTTTSAAAATPETAASPAPQDNVDDDDEAERGANAATRKRGALLASLHEEARRAACYEQRLLDALLDGLRGSTRRDAGSGAGRVQLGALVQRSAEWRSARRGALTASAFGVAAGVSRYAAPRALWETMVGVVVVPRGEDAENAHTRRGRTFEPRAVDEYLRFRRVRALAGGGDSREPRWPRATETGLWLHALHPELGASPDRLLDGEDGLVEVKCPERAPASGVSREHMAQVQGQLEVCGRGFCDYVSFHAASGSLRVFRVPRSPAYAAWLMPRLLDFVRCLRERVPPAPLSEQAAPPPPDVPVSELVLFETAPAAPGSAPA